jgi:hypothetical protein
MAIIGRRNRYTGEIPKISHKELVDRAFLWLKFGQNCSVVFKERHTSVHEHPDAIGWRSGNFSVVVECKASRADFLADKQKSFRQNPESGMGYNRYFMAPVGMLEPDEMPEGWGLLEVYDKEYAHQKSRPVREAKQSKDFFERNGLAEVNYLVSAIRRIEISLAVFVEKEESPESV